MSDYIRLLEKELNYQKDLFKIYSKAITSAPEGYISIRKNRAGTQREYHACNDAVTKKRKRKILAAVDLDLSEKLKFKAFAKCCLPRVNNNIHALQNCLSRCAEFDPQKIEINLGRGYEGIALRFMESNYAIEKNAQWEAIIERQNNLSPENLRYGGPGGTYRSKSEMVIAMQLSRFNILFKYEPTVNIGNFKFCPDFVMLNPIDRTLVYWEHLGLLDNEKYDRSNDRKLALYYAHGIRPGDNLIITCDGDMAPLSALKIERIIKANFA